MIYVGTTGWSYNHWRGKFYPKVRSDSFNELEFYAQHSKLNEINTTFYSIPTEFMVRRWYHYTPKDFIFAAKLPRDVTHVSQRNMSKNPRDIIQKFFSRMVGLEEKFQICIIQFPPGFRKNETTYSYLEQILERCRSNFLGIIQVEFRNASWFTNELKDLLKKQEVGFVDTPIFKLKPELLIKTIPAYYIRLLGNRKAIPDKELGKVHLNKNEELESWVQKISVLSRSYNDIFVVINNRFSGFAINDAITLRYKLSQANIPVSGFYKTERYIRGQLRLEEFLH
ncbi:MAG: DUF72 domain-containing protein [Candidatus Hodarchaeales archaeon]